MKGESDGRGEEEKGQGRYGRWGLGGDNMEGSGLKYRQVNESWRELNQEREPLIFFSLQVAWGWSLS